MPGPILRIEGVDVILDSGTTLGDLTVTYPGCYVVHNGHRSTSGLVVLQDDVTYELRTTNNVGKY
jgi:hypothetical protein